MIIWRYWVWLIEIGNYGNFFVLLPLPLANLKPWKIRILKKWKKLLEISSFYIYVPKTTIIDLQFQRYRVRRTKFFVIFSHFLPFYNPNNLKNQNFASGDVIISHRRTKNHDHMMYASWDVERDRNFCHFGPLFALLST